MRLAVRDRVPGADLGALGLEPAGEDEARRLAHVVGAGLEREPEERDLLPAQRPEPPLELPDHAPLLELVDLDHRGEQLEVVARVGGELLERERVLREAGSAVPDSCTQEVPADAVVEAHALRDLDHVRAGRLADVGDLVDERDAHHQRRVRRELDHLRRGDVRPDDGCVDAGVEASMTSASASSKAPMTIRSGCEEVVDRRSLGGELRVRDVADALEAALVEAMADGRSGSDGHRALHGEDDAAVDRRQLVDHGPDRGQVGVAGDGRRRSDGDVDDVGALERLVDLHRVREPLPVPLQEIGKPLLVDRHPAAAKRVDLLGDDVADDDVVPQVGEAGTGDEADVAGAEDCDLHGRNLAPGARDGLRPFAIAIIVSFDIRSRSVLTTQ